MKYVMFKQGPLYMPIIFPDHVTHSQVKVDGAVPDSAGFMRIGFESKIVTVYGRSESLNIGRKDHDQQLLQP